MNIAEAERRTGLTRANIRFYEKERLAHADTRRERLPRLHRGQCTDTAEDHAAAAAAPERARHPRHRERRESAARGGGRPARRIAGGHPRERTGVCDVPRHLRGQSGVERAGCRPVPVHRAARRRPARERPHPAGRLPVAALLCPQCGCRTVWAAVVDAVAVGVPHQSGNSSSLWRVWRGRSRAGMPAGC